MEQLSSECLQLRTWMIISAVIYAVGGLSFLLGQNRLLENLNRASQLLFRDRLPLIPLSTEKFWLALVNSMMLMLVVISIFAAADIEKYYMMVTVILFSKAFSSIQYLLMFIFGKRYLAYLVGFLSDGPLFLVTLFFFLRCV